MARPPHYFNINLKGRVPPEGSALHWRVYVDQVSDTQGGSVTNTTLRYINFSEEVGELGPMDGTVTASSVSGPNAATEPLDEATGYWASNNGDQVGAWWKMSFPTYVVIKQVTIRGQDANSTPRYWRLQKSSDNANWEDVLVVDETPKYFENNKRTYVLPEFITTPTPTAALYWKVTMDAVQPPTGGYQVDSFRFNEVIGVDQTNMANLGYAFCTDEMGNTTGGNPMRVFQGASWYPNLTADQIPGTNFGFAYNAPFAVREISAFIVYICWVKEFTVSYSNDYVNWTDYAHIPTISSWAQNTGKRFVLTDYLI